VPITTKVVSSNPAHGEVYPMQHYAIQFVSDFFPGTPVSSTNKTDRHDVTEILLKVKHHKSIWCTRPILVTRSDLFYLYS
jgi:hypothetical protein